MFGHSIARYLYIICRIKLFSNGHNFTIHFPCHRADKRKTFVLCILDQDPSQHLIVEMQIQALKNIGCGMELQTDRQDLRPCDIVTENVPALPASVRSTINQAAEVSY